MKAFFLRGTPLALIWTTVSLFSTPALAELETALESAPVRVELANGEMVDGGGLIVGGSELLTMGMVSSNRYDILVDGHPVTVDIRHNGHYEGPSVQAQVNRQLPPGYAAFLEFAALPVMRYGFAGFSVTIERVDPTSPEDAQRVLVNILEGEAYNSMWTPFPPPFELAVVGVDRVSGSVVLSEPERSLSEQPGALWADNRFQELVDRVEQIFAELPFDVVLEERDEAAIDAQVIRIDAPAFRSRF